MKKINLFLALSIGVLAIPAAAFATGTISFPISLDVPSVSQHGLAVSNSGYEVYYRAVVVPANTKCTRNVYEGISGTPAGYAYYNSKGLEVNPHGQTFSNIVSVDQKGPNQLTYICSYVLLMNQTNPPTTMANQPAIGGIYTPVSQMSKGYDSYTFNTIFLWNTWFNVNNPS